MKKQLLRTALLLCMCLCLLPVGVMTAEADNETHTHKVGEQTLDFAPTSTLPDQRGNYYLTGDVTIDKTWEPKDGTVLDLNGYSITYKNKDVKGSVIKVNASVTFTLYDCNGKNTTHYGQWVTTDGTAVYNITDSKPSSGEYDELPGGMVSGGSGTESDYGVLSGGGVYVASGNLADDGSILKEPGIFQMFGGTIVNNTAHSGGGVYIDTGSGENNKMNGTFSMSGGTIIGNTATYGGGVYVFGTFKMSGGTITDNLATGSYTDGGGVYASDAVFQISGTPVIKGNYSETAVDNVSMYHTDVDVVGNLTGNAFIGITESEFVDVADMDLVLFADGICPDENAKYFYSDEADHVLYLEDGKIKQHIFTAASNYTICSGCNHTRSLTYSHEENSPTITEYFSDTNDCTACSYTGTLTIEAPAKTTYADGKSAAATLETAGWLGDTSGYSITYAKDLGNGSSAGLSAAPTDAGNYIVSVTIPDVTVEGTTISGATASKKYTISPATMTAPDSSAYTIDYSAETISFTDAYEMSKTASDETDNLFPTESKIVPGKTYYIRTKASDLNHVPSDWVSVSISARPAAPTGLTTTSASSQSASDGKLSNVAATMEYSTSTTGPWTAVSGTEVTGLAAGTYYVRYQATKSSFASEATAVTVGVKTYYYPTQKPADTTKPDDTDKDDSTDDICGDHCPSLAFTDLNTHLWYHACVDFVLNVDLMEGMSDATFQPTGTLTRAMLVQVLYNEAGRPEVTAQESPFTDVSLDAWYAEAIIWGESTGVIEGYGDGTFGPEDYVTREQMAAMFWRYEGRQQPTQETLDFTDAADVSGWAMEALLWANESGIITGMGDGTLAPRATATRAQAAQVLMNYLKNK